MKIITIMLPEPYIKALEVLVGEGRYPNRSEAVRTAVRDFIKEEFSQNWLERVKDKEELVINENNNTEASDLIFKELNKKGFSEILRKLEL